MSDDPRNARRHSDSDRDNDTRSPGMRDRDRILYSSAFRRMSGITQVISPTGLHPTHNRLTHSLEVAQIGRSIANKIKRDNADAHGVATITKGGGLDADVVEAACLVHDIGHPPFGHLAEEVLNELIDASGGFEGNAQVMRVVTDLSAKSPEFLGLNLTRATLSATTKYPWKRGENPKKDKKWGYYANESESFVWSREHLPEHLKAFDPDADPKREFRTLEAQIMDWADDVAYAVHDVEDFVRVGLVPVDRLQGNPTEFAAFLESHLYREDIPSSKHSAHKAELRQILAAFPWDGGFKPYHENRAELRQYTSNRVTEYIATTQLGTNQFGDTILKRGAGSIAQVSILKSLIWHYVIHGTALAGQRAGQESVISDVFTLLQSMATSDDHRRTRDFGLIIPAYLIEAQERLGGDKAAIDRIIVDFIAGTSEPQLVDLHKRLKGHALGSALDPIIY